MSTFTATGLAPSDNIIEGIGDLAGADPFGAQTTTQFGLQVPGEFAIIFHGTFVVGAGLFPESGTITGVTLYNLESGQVEVSTWEDFSIDVETEFVPWVNGDDAAALINAIWGGNDTITGGAQEDELVGYGGDDFIEGGDGADILDGGAGMDYLDGGDGADRLILFTNQLSAFNDEHFHGGDGNDTLVVQFSGVIAADFSLNNVSSIERLEFATGFGPTQPLFAVFSAFQLGGGISNALVVQGSASIDVVTIFATQAGTVDLSGWTFENWTGGGFADTTVFIQSTDNDTYIGTSGTDIVSSGANIDANNGGIDIISTGADNDYIAINGMVAGESIDGGAGLDRLMVQRGLTQVDDIESPIDGFWVSDYSAGTLLSIEGVNFNFMLNISVDANQHKLAVFDADQIGAGGLSLTANIRGVANFSQIVQINAIGGALDLSGWTFTDWNPIVDGDFAVGADAVYVFGSAIADTITGTSQGDRVDGEDGNDFIVGGGGDDSLEGAGGVDSVFGGTGDDLIEITSIDSPAGETLDGGADNDVLYIEFDGATSVDFTGATVTSFEQLEYDNGLYASNTPLFAVFSASQIGSGLSSSLVLRGSGSIDVVTVVASSASNVNLSGWTFDGWIPANGFNDLVVFLQSSGNDTFVGTSMSDLVSSGLDITGNNGGVDTFDLGAGDDFIAVNGMVAGEVINGGSGLDRLLVQRGATQESSGPFNTFYRSDFTAGTLTSIEIMNFGSLLGITTDPNQNKLAVLNQSQLGAGLSSTATILGVNGFSQVVQINASGGTVNLNGWTFNTWTSMTGTFSAGEDVIYIVGSGSNETVIGSSQGDWILGAGGIDTLSGGNGEDIIDGGLGNDTITGGGGNDTINGGDGDDIINYSFGEGIDAAINGGNGTDRIVTTGNAGGETLDAFWNGTSFTGFKGSSVASIEEATADLGGGIDWLRQHNSSVAVTINLTTGAASGFVSIANIENAWGSAFADTITGSSVANTLRGAAGNDTIDGGDGNDTLIGEDGLDTLNGGNGADTFYGLAGADTVNGGDGDDTIYSSFGEGVDAIDGGAGTDTIICQGNSGAETLEVAWDGTGFTFFKGGAVTSIEQASADMGVGGDWLRYTNSTVGISIDLGANTATGFISLASVENAGGGNFDDTITGSGIANNLLGNGGADTINGAGGNDTINGGAGADIIIGGAGGDTMIGGADSDTFVFATGSGIDTIIDFDANAIGGQDFLDIAGYGITSGDFGARVVITDLGANTLVTIDGTNTILLSGVTGDGNNVITQADFILA